MKEKSGTRRGFTVKDIVFLAVISAITVCTAAVMAIVSHIYIFGLAQLVTALQFSLFPAIALSKVRKPGSLLLFAVFTGIILLFMAPVMFFSNLITGLVLEVICNLVCGGYEKKSTVFVAGWLFVPLTLPLNLLYYRMFGQEYWDLFFHSGVQVLSIVFVIATILVTALGAFLGLKIGGELKKAGVLKN